MATFQLKDGFGLDVSVNRGPGALSKYFKNIPDIAVSTINLAQLGASKLSDPAVKSIAGNLTFGFNGSSSVGIAYYQLFGPGQQTVLDAAKDTIADFAIPADLDDIGLM